MYANVNAKLFQLFGYCQDLTVILYLFRQMESQRKKKKANENGEDSPLISQLLVINLDFSRNSQGTKGKLFHRVSLDSKPSLVSKL